MTNILSLPGEIVDKVLSYMKYDEVSRLRLVCKTFDSAAQRVLNQGFYKVEKYHAQCLRKVKEQLPRRESERRKHPLSVHCDILTSIETRLSLLGMTFMKYVELKYCCFIPGKVLDEIFKILRFVSAVSVPPRAHDILQELRDISSMAMEHFDEKIAPAFRARNSATPKLSVTSYGALTGSSRQYTSGNSSSQRGSNYASEFAKLHACIRQNHNKYLELKKESTETKRKVVEYRKKLNEQDRRMLEQANLIVQQNTRIADQTKKITDLTKKFAECERSIADLGNSLLHLKEEVPHGTNSSNSLNAPKSEKPLKEAECEPKESKTVDHKTTANKRKSVLNNDKKKRQKR